MLEKQIEKRKRKKKKQVVCLCRKPHKGIKENNGTSLACVSSSNKSVPSNAASASIAKRNPEKPVDNIFFICSLATIHIRLDI